MMMGAEEGSTWGLRDVMVWGSHLCPCVVEGDLQCVHAESCGCVRGTLNIL